MRCFLEFISTPTSDTPGTLLLLHFDDKRYLIGNLSEGSSRACLQHGTGLRKVGDAILTGPVRWANIGGLLGMVLGLADVKHAAAEAAAQSDREQNLRRKQQDLAGKQQKQKTRNGNAQEEAAYLNIHGGPNLNYAIATARRFIFRTGMPLNAFEHAAEPATEARTGSIFPTWEDDKLKCWAMPILPTCGDSSTSTQSSTSARKRSFEEANGDGSLQTSQQPLPKRIVKQMFDSDWRMDRLTSQNISEVRMPATLFVRDPESGHIMPYTGPLPGGAEPLPDVKVLVRQPWPGALTETLPPTTPAPESVCYIIRNHPQRGKFKPERAKEFEVPKGRLWSQLANGQAVRNQHGKEVTPDMVLEPGKQGGGVAIIELPSVAYVETLISRPEWRDPGVMEGVEAVIWILGPGLRANKQLQRFRTEFAHLKHIEASADETSNHLALETPARSVARHCSADGLIFPALVRDPSYFGQPLTEGSLDEVEAKGQVIKASRGLVLTLEPRVEIESENCTPPINPNELNIAAQTELDQLIKDEPSLAASLEASDPGDWSTQLPFGDAEITTLGTGSSHPSTHRNVSATLVRVPGCGSYLFDCGESTLGALQRMYTREELQGVFRDLKMIWVSHMHADHHLGTTSVIKAWYQAVHGGIPSRDRIEAQDLGKGHPRLAIVSEVTMINWLREYSNVEDFGFSRLLPLAVRATRNAADPATRTKTQLFPKAEDTRTSEDADVADEKTSLFLQYLGLSAISTVYVRHCRGAQAISVTFGNGLKVSYSGDCRPSAEFAAVGEGTHVLIHEATFEDDMRGEAIAKKHSTAGEALVVAAQMKAKACVLTHFSQRYPKMPPLGVASGPNVRSPSPELISAMLETQNGEGNGDDEGPLEREKVPDQSHTERTLVTPLQNGLSNQDLSSEYSMLIDSGSVKRLISESGLRVVMAFDYMRLKLKDLPRLEAKQPLLRAMYDRLGEKGEAGAEKTKTPGQTDEAMSRKQEKRQARKAGSGG